jgi:molybdenum cofactor cytidylyltransferase
MNQLEGIVLAAGLSTRTGKFKLIQPLGDKKLIEWSISTISSICKRTIVVGGYNYQHLKEVLEKYPDITLVYNKNYKDGMFSSVKCGVRQVNAERFFILPGDQPFVRQDTYLKLLSFEKEIVIPRYKGKKGHPVLINGSLAPEILAMPDDSSLRDFIYKKNSLCVDVDDPGVLIDVDNFTDLQYACEYLKGLEISG